MEVDGELVRAGGGAANAVVLHRARDAGLGGFEFACAIPGTAGGGVWMNAGAYGGDFAQVLERALVVDADGARWLTPSELGLRYRHSELRHGQVVAEVELRLVPRPIEEIKATVAELQAQRKAAQPTNKRTFGSVFKNPEHELSRGPDARGLRAEGLPDRRRADLAAPRELHRERRRGRLGRRDRADGGGAPACVATSSASSSSTRSSSSALSSCRRSSGRSAGPGGEVAAVAPAGPAVACAREPRRPSCRAVAGSISVGCCRPGHRCSSASSCSRSALRRTASRARRRLFAIRHIEVVGAPPEVQHAGARRPRAARGEEPRRVARSRPRPQIVGLPDVRRRHPRPRLPAHAARVVLPERARRSSCGAATSLARLGSRPRRPAARARSAADAAADLGAPRRGRRRRRHPRRRSGAAGGPGARRSPATVCRLASDSVRLEDPRRRSSCGRGSRFDSGREHDLRLKLAVAREVLPTAVRSGPRTSTSAFPSVRCGFGGGSTSTRGRPSPMGQRTLTRIDKHTYPPVQKGSAQRPSLHYSLRSRDIQNERSDR